MTDEVDESTLGSVAQPRRLVSTGTYMGDELASMSSRPGAYDAMKLPSLFNGRQHVPGALTATSPVRYVPPPPAPAPAAAPPAIQAPQAPKKECMSYSPREGSLPFQVLAALQHLGPGGYMSNREISSLFGVPQKAIPAHLLLAIGKGALIRVNVHGTAGIALPGFQQPSEPLQAQTGGHQQPPDRPAPSPAPTPAPHAAIAQIETKETNTVDVGHSLATLSVHSSATPPFAASIAATPDFAAALWADGQLELHGVSVPDDGCGYLRLSADQVKQIACLLGGRVFA